MKLLELVSYFRNGGSYEYSHLQNRKDHRNQHKYDNGGRKNKERPIQ